MPGIPQGFRIDSIWGAASDDVYFPVTLGDFIGVYENAAKTLEAAS